jgi:hypothetical protein
MGVFHELDACPDGVCHTLQVKQHCFCSAVWVPATDCVDDGQVLRKGDIGPITLSRQLDLEPYRLAAESIYGRLKPCRAAHVS